MATSNEDKFDELRARVEANQSVLTVRMEELRDAFGVRRLGVHVCDQIESRLAGVGLGHFPHLEPDGWMEVRLFKLGTPMAELILAATEPGAPQDATLRAKVESEASATLAQIRALVCE
jgi:hypothetical protein